MTDMTAARRAWIALPHPHTLRLPTPLGPLDLRLEGGTVRAAWFAEGSAAEALPPATPELRRIAERVAAYFAGEVGALDEIPADPLGTACQRQVWEALRRIPAGEVRTYAGMAGALGRPGAARAVGAACARNPVALIIPCHRVVGTGGSLTGYAFGVERKRALLAHEAAGRGRMAGEWFASASPWPSFSGR